ncbi:trimeric intracellular cation channel family protein [Halarcobacter anaerophilus]|uniref:trimeric intracellular cation channel family protein n=1 Tax=Halarcobacter anaerophilus TaxID=877500 RepID=UPI0005C93E52|nr:TRIC cation channel family protein [Halarcobacter anaerophilus]
MSALEIADIIGIISFAVSGFLIAVHMKLDILGIFISAFLTAFGGGLIRDIIANQKPFIFTDILPFTLVIITVILSIIFKLHKITHLEGKKAFVLTDTIGLVSFSISGAMIAHDVGFNVVGVVLLALLTAVGGGTLRDIVINRIPAVLVSDFYGAVAIIIGLIIYILDCLEWINYINLLITFAFGIALRLHAYYKKWHLPKLS